MSHRAPKGSRFCACCPTSRMPAGSRHLHELERGMTFRFDGEEAARSGERWVLEHAGVSRCTIVPAAGSSGARQRRTFETAEGEQVSFFAGPASLARPCAGGAQVVPIPL